MIKNCFLFSSFLLCIIFNLSGQDHDHDHDHHDHHHHHVNEIAIALTPVYFVNENEFSFGLHLHYVRMIKESNFGLGFAYELIFDEHGHNTIGVLANYRAFDHLNLGLSPGITFAEHDGEAEVNFAIHFETSYEFELGDFHLGPAFEVAYDIEDVHLSLGLHIGYGF